MKFAWLGFILTIVLFGLHCQHDQLIIGPNNPQHATGQMVLSIAQPPGGIIRVVAKLSRQGYDTITVDLRITDVGTSAGATVNDIAAGVWHLKVMALDTSDNIRYAGETDVTIVAGETTTADLELLPASGILQIRVRWGSNLLFSDDFNKGNINQWTSKTGIWDFVDSLVQTDEDFGHHFLMLPGHDFRSLELKADVMKTSDDNDAEHPGIVFRWTTDTNNYVFRINGVGSQSWIQLMQDMDHRDMNAKYIHTEPWLQNESDRRMDRDVWYTMKVRAVGSHIQCKVWKKSDSEPPGWNIDLQDSTYSHGAIGLEYFTGRHRFDNVVARSLN